MFSISDLILENPSLSDEEILALIVHKSGMPEEEIRAMLKRYPRAYGTLEDHYKIILENEQLAAVKAVYDRLGIPFDPHSDCLIDGFRFAASYGQLKRITRQTQHDARSSLEGVSGESERIRREWLASAIQEEREGCQATIDAFHGRLVRHHRIDPQVATVLLTELSQVIVYNVGPGELNVPRPMADSP